MGALNHPVPFIIAVTIAVTALQVVLSMLAKMIGVDALASFFRPAVGN